MTILRVEKSNSIYARKNTTTITLYSDHIYGRQDMNIYHHLSDKKDIPIVILLHGVYGSSNVWMDLGGAHVVYDQLRAKGLAEFIIVMPSDGGLWDGSGYLPLKGHGNYEKWIVEDVINGVIDNIDSASSSSNIYISGLSMGGYGALRLGAKYPKLFSGISVHSSVTSLTDLQQFIDNPVSDYICEDINEPNISYWLEKNRDDLAPLRLDCGEDDSLYVSNLNLCKTLDDLKIHYEFSSFSGGHEWAYWHKHLATTLKFFNFLESGSN